MATWVMTGSLENLRIYAQRGFEVIGLVPAEDLVHALDHLRKWPPEHWHLAFQDQLRTVTDADARLLRERITAAAQRSASAVAAE